MTLRQIGSCLLALVVVLLVFRWGLSPLRTRLPQGTTDLTTVEAELQRLTPEEQKLVRDYTLRSKGEYFPSAYSDPDAPPLDARTFGDAIKLQRRFLAMLDESRAEMRARMAQREATLAPMRAVLQLEMVGRELAPVSPAYGPQPRDLHGATPALPQGELEAITRWRVRNVSSRAVTSFEGGARAYRSDSDILSPELLNHCYIEHVSLLQPGASVDVGCSDRSHDPDRDRGNLALPASMIRVDWMPRRIAFTDGTELKYDGH